MPQQRNFIPSTAGAPPRAACALRQREKAFYYDARETHYNRFGPHAWFDPTMLKSHFSSLLKIIFTTRITESLNFKNYQRHTETSLQDPSYIIHSFLRILTPHPHIRILFTGENCSNYTGTLHSRAVVSHLKPSPTTYGGGTRDTQSWREARLGTTTEAECG